MASNLKFATDLRTARADAITTFAGGSCLLRIYDGTQATNPQTAIGAQNLLAELTCNATFAPGASSGVLTLNAITTDSTANNTGTASWFRLVKSNGTTVVMDGTVGTSASDIIINSVAISAGAAVAVTSAILTEGNA
jgi:hypothetical protein